MIKKHLFAFIYALMLTAFSIYVVMDTFVITRVYDTVPRTEAAAVTDDTSGDAGSKDTDETTDGEIQSGNDSLTAVNETETDVSAKVTAVSTDTTYQDESITITVTEYREYDTSIYVADIQLSSPEYLKTALAKSAYGKNVTEKTSEMALAKGYVLRNGVLYRSTAEKGQEDLVIYEDGSFEIITEDEVTAEELLERGAVQILSFGPALVTDSTIAVTTEEEIGKARSSNPRTAIGVIDDLHYLFVVSDGRTEESEGLTLYQLAQIMTQLGAETAYNLDGGGSSSMVFGGVVINNPTTNGNRIKERSVSDIVYIG